MPASVTVVPSVVTLICARFHQIVEHHLRFDLGGEAAFLQRLVYPGRGCRRFLADLGSRLAGSGRVDARCLGSRRRVEPVAGPVPEEVKRAGHDHERHEHQPDKSSNHRILQFQFVG